MNAKSRRRAQERLRQTRNVAALQDLTGVHRTRNGTLALDWLTRTSRPRWRMLRLDGQWYDLGALRGSPNFTARSAVPHSYRRLSNAEERDVLNARRYSLAPWLFTE